MAAGGEIEAHEGIAGLQQRQKHRLVHLAAGVRLHVGELRAEQLLGALDRQRLGDVDPFAAAVIARARIAFGIFVGHHRALRFQHRPADDVFRRDQLDLMTLAAEFALDRGGDFRDRPRQGGREERVGRGGGFGGGVHVQKSLAAQPVRPGANDSYGRYKRREPDSTLIKPAKVLRLRPNVRAIYGGYENFRETGGQATSLNGGIPQNLGQDRCRVDQQTRRSGRPASGA